MSQIWWAYIHKPDTEFLENTGCQAIVSESLSSCLCLSCSSNISILALIKVQGSVHNKIKLLKAFLDDDTRAATFGAPDGCAGARTPEKCNIHRSGRLWFAVGAFSTLVETWTFEPWTFGWMLLPECFGCGKTRRWREDRRMSRPDVFILPLQVHHKILEHGIKFQRMLSRNVFYLLNLPCLKDIYIQSTLPKSNLYQSNNRLTRP